MNAPAPVCRVDDLSGPGAFFTQDIEETPVIVARDLRDSVRAFVNLCRHQGARLVHERSGVAKSFTCILHGWNYDLEGQMGGGPLAKLAQTNPLLAQIRTTNALTPLPCEIRHGFVWVSPVPHGPIDVAAFLGPVDALLGGSWRVDELAPAVIGATHVLSETTKVVVGADGISIFARCRKRGETDFGHDIGGATTETVVHWRLRAAAATE